MNLDLLIPDSAVSALGWSPEEVAPCLLLMAAAKLYEVGELSQERASELAGLTRHEFIDSLSSLGVSPFQGVEEDLEWIDSHP